MPQRQIGNVGQAFGGPIPSLSSQVLIEVVNNSGGTLKQGDVVIIDATGRLATTTATINDPVVFGVISNTGDARTDGELIAVAGLTWVCVGGVARVNVGANTVAAKGILGSTTVAKVADDTVVLSVAGTAFGVALEANTATDANSTIRAIIDKV